MLRRLLTGHCVQHNRRTDHEQNAHDGEHHSAIVASLGQVKATGIDHGQRGLGVGAAFVLRHVDLLAADGSGGNPQLVFQVLLGNVLQIDVTLNDLGIAGVILDQAQSIGSVNGAAFGAFLLGDGHLNILLQQHIAVVGADFGHSIGIIFYALNENPALGITGFHRNKVRGIFLVGSVAGHIVHAFVLIQPSLYKVIIGLVLYQKLHLGEIALAVREQLGEVNTVGINMPI